MIFKSLLKLNNSIISSLIFQSPLPIFSLKFLCTTTTLQSQSFTFSYLINNLGFSSKAALIASKRLRFNTSKKPEAVLNFFRTHGFSDSQVCVILRRTPQLLLCNPHKFLLPKFEFLASKGASRSEIVVAGTKNPSFLIASLESNIIPMYALMRRFFESDKKTLDYLIAWTKLLKHGKQNLKLLQDEGVSDSNIAYLIRMRAFVFHANGLKKAVDEVKELGIDPSKVGFVVALVAKMSVSKPKWKAKVDAYKSWGLSEEAIASAFRRRPYFMLTSKDKINAMMSFCVNQLGWDSSDLVTNPTILGFSLEKRMIPRASVIQYLLTKGLMKKNASLMTPFIISEKSFLEKYVNIFKEESFHLLKLYQGTKKGQSSALGSLLVGSPKYKCIQPYLRKRREKN